MKEIQNAHLHSILVVFFSQSGIMKLKNISSSFIYLFFFAQHIRFHVCVHACAAAQLRGNIAGYISFPTASEESKYPFLEWLGAQTAKLRVLRSSQCEVSVISHFATHSHFDIKQDSYIQKWAWRILNFKLWHTNDVRWGHQLDWWPAWRMGYYRET